MSGSFINSMFSRSFSKPLISRTCRCPFWILPLSSASRTIRAWPSMRVTGSITICFTSSPPHMRFAVRVSFATAGSPLADLDSRLLVHDRRRERIGIEGTGVGLYVLPDLLLLYPGEKVHPRSDHAPDIQMGFPDEVYGWPG